MSVAGTLACAFLTLRGFLAPTGAMVNSQGLPAPGPRSHSGPRGWKPLAIFPCPFGAENKQRNIKTCTLQAIPSVVGLRI